MKRRFFGYAALLLFLTLPLLQLALTGGADSQTSTWQSSQTFINQLEAQVQSGILFKGDVTGLATGNLVSSIQGHNVAPGGTAAAGNFYSFNPTSNRFELLPSAAVPMNSQKFTGLAAGAASGDSIAFGQTGAQLNSLLGSGTGPGISGFDLDARINVQAHGAVGDLTSITNATATASSGVVGGSGFTSAMAGKVALLEGGAPAGITTQSAGPSVTLRQIGAANTNYYTASTIAFTAESGSTPAALADSANGLAGFTVGMAVMVSGTTGGTNDSTYIVVTSAAGSLGLAKTLSTTVASYSSSSSITLTANSQYTLTSNWLRIGTDNAGFIQSALNAVPASGAAVVFPCQAQYLIGTTLTPQSNTVLTSDCGPGAYPKILASGNINGVTLASVSNVSISSLYLDGNKREFPSSGNNAISQSSGTALSNISIVSDTITEWGGAGVQLLPPSGVFDSGVYVQSNTISDIGAHAIVAQGSVSSGVFGSVSNLWIQNNNVTHWGETYSNRSCITASRYGARVHIDDNTCAGDSISLGTGSAHGISLDTTYDVEASGNHIDGANGIGIEDGSSSLENISGNIVTNSRTGIQADAAGADVTGTTAATTTASAAVVTNATGVFYPALAHKGVKVSGCYNSGTLITTIAKVNSPTQITLDDTCGATQSGNVTVSWAIVAADTEVAHNQIYNSGQSNGGALYFSDTSFSAASRTTADVTCTNGSTTISSPTFGFAANQVGRGLTLNNCGSAGGSMNAVVTSITNSTTAVISAAASTSQSGAATITMATPYGMNVNAAIIGNTVSGAAGAGVLIDHTWHVNLASNIVRGSPQSGIYIASADNYVTLAGNESYYNNTSVAGGHAGIFANFTTATGTVFLISSPNLAMGNGAGGGAAADESYEIDGSLTNFTTFAFTLLNPLAPSRGGGVAFGTSSHPWLVSATNVNTGPAVTSQSGTSGTAACSMSMQGTLKIATCYLSGYAETGSAQTYTYPVGFSTSPVLQESGGSCGTYNPSTSATVLTLPANASMTAETCNVVAIGQ